MELIMFDAQIKKEQSLSEHQIMHTHSLPLALSELSSIPSSNRLFDPLKM